MSTLRHNTPLRNYLESHTLDSKKSIDDLISFLQENEIGIDDALIKSILKRVNQNVHGNYVLYKLNNIKFLDKIEKVEEEIEVKLQEAKSKPPKKKVNKYKILKAYYDAQSKKERNGCGFKFEYGLSDW